jgi:hypothetical protein
VITGQRLLGIGLPVWLTVESNHDVSRARNLADAAAQAQGFDQIHRERAALVATEIATNLVRQSPSGRICVQLLESGDLKGVEILALDPVTVAETRVAGVDQSGHSHPGPETIAGLSDLFDSYSAPGRGTVTMSRMWGGKPDVPSEGGFVIGSMIDPIPGEEVSGDAWAAEQSGNRVVALVADGLGHGIDAAAASVAAVEVFRERHKEPVEEITGHIHRALRGTRGAAIAVAEVDPDIGRIRFCGIGNISARLLVAGVDSNLISHFGIAGYQARHIRAFEETWEDGALLVMHSDGLVPTWDLGAYPGLLGHHPQLAAATVMRDAPRATDDALVLALRVADGSDATTAFGAR